jgi:hypothetical protein
MQCLHLHGFHNSLLSEYVPKSLLIVVSLYRILKVAQIKVCLICRSLVPASKF